MVVVFRDETALHIKVRPAYHKEPAHLCPPWGERTAATEIKPTLSHTHREPLITNP